MPDDDDGKIHEIEEERRRRRKIVARAFGDVKDLPSRQFFYGRHYLQGAVSCTIADAGVGKSSLAVVEAVAMVIKRPLLGIEPVRRLRVLLWNGEESADELHRRVHAVCHEHRVDYQELNGALFVVSGLDYPIQMQPGAPRLLNDLEEFIRDEGIDVVMLDPLIALHSVPEDKNQQIDNIVRQWLSLAGRRLIAVDIAHHTRKAPPGSTVDMTSHDARGASALRAACRSGRVLNQLSAEDAQRYDIRASERTSFVRIDGDKMNYASTGAEAWLRIISQTLANGDEVGAMISWRPPDQFAGIAMRQIEEIWQSVGVAVWRADWRSKKWLGILVAEICQLDAEQDRKRIEGMIKAWIKSGMLVEREHKEGDQRKAKLFIDAGPNNPCASAQA